MHARLALAASFTLALTTAAAAQPAPPETPAAEEPPATPPPPGRGDFDAGGQVRLPSGPDEMGQFGSFHWIAVDGKARYFLLDSVTANATIPIALVKPDELMDGTDPKMFGGAHVHLDAMLPKLPKLPFMKYETEVGVTLGAAYLREGAMLLGEKDYPLFTGGFEPGLSGGLITKIKLGQVVDFAFTPSYVWQSGSDESLTAIQVPMTTVVRLGSLVAASADVGVYTGDDLSLRGKNGGRIAAGGSLTVKLGPILAHAGAGVASLLTGGAYPTIGDSVYLDLNVKYAP